MGQGDWTEDGGFSVATQNDTADGINVYVRVFDSTTMGTSGWFLDLAAVQYGPTGTANPDGTWTIAFGGGLGDYVTPGSLADGSDWQPIPEPTSMALFGLGLVTIAVRRRIRKA